MLAKLKSPFKEFGCVAGLLYAADRALQRLSPNLRLYFYELFVKYLPVEPLLPNRLVEGVEIREIRSDDPEIARMPARPDIKESRFKQNAICLGEFQENQFIGHIWFCFHAYEEDEFRCTFVLPEGVQAVFDFDLYIFPEYRVGLALARMFHGANEFLRSRGVKFLFSRISRTNLASRLVQQRLGARRVGRLFVLRTWRVEFMVATVSPYVHLSFRERDRVRVKLRPD